MKMKNIFIKVSAMICLLGFLALTVIPVDARPRAQAYPVFAFKHIPPGSQRVSHGGIHYVVHKGRFYKPWKAGYILIRRPVGVVVYSLPAAAITMVVAGLTYYVYDNIYYRKVPSGYQVVWPPQVAEDEAMPVQTMASVPPGTKVLVLAKSLNVRSGPGLNHPVKSQVHYGNMLTAQGNAQDWIYVLLPNGSNGWVMTRFISIPDTSSKG